MSQESTEGEDKGLISLLDREMCLTGKCGMLLGKQKEHCEEVLVTQAGPVDAGFPILCTGNQTKASSG